MISCGQSSKSNQETVEIAVIDLTDNLKTKMIGVVTTIKTDEGIQYGYTESEEDSTFDYSITKDVKNDSILIYDDGKEICHLTGARTYDIQNRQITVQRYLYDVAGVFDEEAALFFVDNYGLIAIDVLAGNQLFFDKGTGSGKYIIENLKNDTQFFRPKVAPPPIPINYDSNEIERELDTLDR